MTPAAPRLSLPQGDAQGRWLDDGAGPALAVFQGLPYAAAPEGAGRFEPPRPAPAWVGLRDACQPAPPARQLGRSPSAPLQGGPDCLTLNIWTPAWPGGASAAPGPCPVLVWVPGGGFMRGNAADPLYDGAALARRGIVVVSFNYRLGVDGFLDLPGCVPNRGLLDQIAALRWVREHIHRLGGDPARLTLMGQSAGAGAITTLLGHPEVHGTVARAILQSPSTTGLTPDEAATLRRALAELLQVPATRAGFESASPDDAVRALARLAQEPALRAAHGLTPRQQFPLRPVAGVPGWPEPPLHALEHTWADGRGPELLVGANRDEMNFYLVPTGQRERLRTADRQAFCDAAGLGPALVDAAHDTLAARWGRPPSEGEWLAELQSDYFYRVPARRLAERARQAGRRAWCYRFDWASPLYRGQLGAAHGMELGFVFGTLHRPEAQAFTGPDAPQALSQAMQSAWADFIQGRSPGWGEHPTDSTEWRIWDTPCHNAPEPALPAAADWARVPGLEARADP